MAKSAKARKYSGPKFSGATRTEKGNVTPAQAAKDRHCAEHVLGEKDSTYHGK